MRPILELKGITKQFPGVLANCDINFMLESGEIHALLGENGAGKTTLMNILYGLLQPDSGEIFIKGEPVHFSSPLDAISHGIGMVHQHFMLVPTMTVTENIILGHELTRGPFLDEHRADEAINHLSNQFSLQVPSNQPVSQLSVGVQQRVEILKVLYRGAEILILDEPTAVLTPVESEALFQTLESFAQQGKSVIFISHKLKEVMRISDRVTVLRHGEVKGSLRTSETDEKEMARLMVGREVVFSIERVASQTGSLISSIERLQIQSDHGKPAVEDFDLDLYSGEIVGVAGVDGNGQAELAQGLSGLRSIKSGSFFIDGHDMTASTIRQRIDVGLMYIPADRKAVGVAPELTIRENAIIKNHRISPNSQGGLLQWDIIQAFTQTLVEQYDVRCPSIEIKAGALSGGNLQKLILGRETISRPTLLIAEHPTRGLDIGAIEYVRKLIFDQRDKGTAVLLISSDLDEVITMSDRIIVMYEGRLVYSCTSDAIDREAVGAAMAGLLT